MSNHSSNNTPSPDHQWMAYIPDDEHLSDEQFEEYVFQLLSPEDVAGVDKHLAICPECTQEMRRSLELAREWMQSDARQNLLNEVRASCDADASTTLASQIDAKSATIALLLRRLTDRNPEIRLRAVQALGNAQPEEWVPDSFPMLRIPLSDQNRDVRVAMIQSIGMIGHIAACPEIIECLIDCLCDEDRTVRYAAAAAVRRFGVAAATQDVLSFLPLAIDSADSETLGAIGMLFTQFRAAAATTDIIQALLKKVSCDRSKLRVAASCVIGTLGAKAATQAVLTALISALRDGISEVRVTAAEALGNLGPASGTQTVVAELCTALQDEEWDVRAAAVSALGRLGSVADTQIILEKIKNLLEDANSTVRISTVHTLAALPSAIDQLEVRDALIRAQSDTNESIRIAAQKVATALYRKMNANAPPDKVAIIIIKFPCLSLPGYSQEGYGGADTPLVQLTSDGSAQVRIQDTNEDDGDLDVIVTSKIRNNFGKPVKLSIADWSEELTFERGFGESVIARTVVHRNIWQSWPTDQDLVIEIP